MKMILLFLFLMFGGLGVYFNHLLSPYEIDKLESHYPVYHKDNLIQGHYEWQKEKPSHWLELGEIPKLAQGAVLVSEDWGFYDHRGISPREMVLSFLDYLKGEKLRGASTLTQQLMKNYFLTSERSFKRKIIEVGLALKVERRLSKERIFEHYLNSVPWGQDQVGIKQAYDFYFKKPLPLIHPFEAAYLAMLLPNPMKFGQSGPNELKKWQKGKVSSILNKMRIAKFISKEDVLNIHKQRLSRR